MFRRRILSALTLASLVAGCGPEATRSVAERSPADAARAEALGARRFEEAVVLLGTSHWGEYVYHGISRQSFRVEFSVRNDSPSKSAGIVWTMDDWATSHEAPAHYEATLPDGRERWAVEVRDFWSGYYGPEVRFSGFVKANGQTSWTPYRNHTVYRSVSVDRPVRVLESRARLDAGGTPLLEGKVRALNVEGAAVFVRYSVDGWKTVRDAAAFRSGDDWAFSVPVEPDAATDAIEKAEFAVRYEAEGETFWDNNDGANHALRLAPAVEHAGFENGGAQPGFGLRVFRASVVGELPLRAASVRVDGAAPTALPQVEQHEWQRDGSGFGSFGGILFVLPSEGLSPGEHTLTLEVAAGPFTRTFGPFEFVVEDGGIRLASSWDLAAVGPWDLRELPDGRVLVLGNNGITRYARWGDATPELTFATSPSSSSKLQLDVDAEGRAYALDMASRITRWLPDGSVDASFGVGGVLAFTGDYFGLPFQHVSDVAVTPQGLFVTDSLNLRVLRFSQNGDFIEAVSCTWGRPNEGSVGRLAFDGQSLWVQRSLYAGGAQTQLLLRIGEYRGRLTVAEAVELDPALGRVQALAVTPTAIVLTGDVGSSSNLHVLERTGRRLATWMGGGRYRGPGALSIANGVHVLADGSVGVASANTQRLERFRLALP